MNGSEYAQDEVDDRVAHENAQDVVPVELATELAVVHHLDQRQHCHVRFEEQCCRSSASQLDRIVCLHGIQKNPSDRGIRE